MPQLELSASGVLLEEDLGSPLQAERTVDAAATESQALYAEPAWANLTRVPTEAPQRAARGRVTRVCRSVGGGSNRL